MSSVIERAGAAAREILEKRTRDGREPLDVSLVTLMIAEGFARGAMWGIERTQHAVAITHARYRTELDSEVDRR